MGWSIYKENHLFVLHVVGIYMIMHIRRTICLRIF